MLLLHPGGEVHTLLLLLLTGHSLAQEGRLPLMLSDRGAEPLLLPPQLGRC